MLICNLRSWTNGTSKSQNNKKSYKILDLLGCTHSFFKNWIEYQSYGDIGVDKYCFVWCIDQGLPIAIFNILDEKEMKNCFNWITLRLMYFGENNLKKAKFNH